MVLPITNNAAHNLASDFVCGLRLKININRVVCKIIGIREKRCALERMVEVIINPDILSKRKQDNKIIKAHLK